MASARTRGTNPTARLFALAGRCISLAPASEGHPHPTRPHRCVAAGLAPSSCSRMQGKPAARGSWAGAGHGTGMGCQRLGGPCSLRTQKHGCNTQACKSAPLENQGQKEAPPA